MHPTLPDPRGESLTGQLCPLGPWVVDATERETPQAVVQQLPVPDPKAQEDAVDSVLCRWLQGREQGMEGGPGPPLRTLSPLLLPPAPPCLPRPQSRDPASARRRDQNDIEQLLIHSVPPNKVTVSLH